MAEGLEKLAEMEYPGRFIIIGQTESGESNVVVYGITGRNESSQARTIECDEKNMLLYTKPTNEEAIQKGIESLLIYPAMFGLSEGIVVSNGYQTNLLHNDLLRYYEGDFSLNESLDESFWIYDRKIGLIDVTSYEPDKPNFTPRISGYCLARGYAEFAIARKKELDEVKEYYDALEIEGGTGKLIATYKGENKDPLPSSKGDLLDVEIKSMTPDTIAKEVYNALNEEFRVSVAVMMQSKKTGLIEYSITNKEEV